MSETRIVSNLAYLAADTYISLVEIDQIPTAGKPREVIKIILKNLAQNFDKECIIIGLRFVGRRVIKNTEKLAKIAEFMSGRRHTFYYGIFFNGKIYVTFSWNKIKKLSKIETEFVEKNWHENFFESEFFLSENCEKLNDKLNENGKNFSESETFSGKKSQVLEENCKKYVKKQGICGKFLVKSFGGSGIEQLLYRLIPKYFGNF